MKTFKKQLEESLSLEEKFADSPGEIKAMLKKMIDAKKGDAKATSFLSSVLKHVEEHGSMTPNQAKAVSNHAKVLN